MAITVANLAVKVAADTGQAQSGILGLATMLGPGGAFVAAGLAAAAVIVGIGAVTVKMAGDFQAGMTSLVTGAGESQKNIGMVSKAVLQMAVDTGTSTSQLTSGLYMIESAGYHGAAGLAILKAAAEGAKVGNADLGTVADATTTLMTDFGTQTGGASGAVNALIATTASGKTHMQDLATSLAQVAPTASAAGVGMNDMLGALATMTGEGVPAANAATYLRQTIMSLDAPGKAAVTTLSSIGLTASQVANGMRVSLPSTLDMITSRLAKEFPQGAALAQAQMAKVNSGTETFNQALQNLSGTGAAGYIDALKNISGGTKTMQGMLDLTGSHLATFQGNVTNISGAVQKGGKSINGWNLVQGDFNQKMDVAKEVVETTGIKIGTALLPVVGRLVDAFSTGLPVAITATVNGIQNVIGFFQGASPAADAVKVALVALGGAMIGFAVSAIPPMVVALWGLVTAQAAAAWGAIVLAAPFIAVGAVVALLVVGIYELVTHWSTVEAIARNVGIWFINLGKTIGTFLSGVWNDITTTVKSWGTAFMNGVKAIQTLVKAGFTEVYNIIMTPVHDIDALFAWLFAHNTYFHDLVLGIQKELATGKAIITTFGNDIKGLFTAAGNAIKTTASNDWNAIETYIIQPIQRAQATVAGVITTVEGDLSRGWGIVSGDAQSAWNRFSGIISGAVGTVGTDVHNIVSAITTPITGLINGAEAWGRNLIQMFINGIMGEVGAVKNAASSVINGAKNILGFHSPAAEGPGADADTWAPNLMKMFAQGIVEAGPLLQSAAVGAMGGVRAGLTGSVSPTMASGLMASPATAQANQANATAQALAGVLSGASVGGQPVVLQLDGLRLGSAMLPYIGKAARMATGIRTN